MLQLSRARGAGAGAPEAPVLPAAVEAMPAGGECWADKARR